MNHPKVYTGADFELTKPDPECGIPKEVDLPGGSSIARHSEVFTGTDFELTRPAPASPELSSLRLDFVKNAGGPDVEPLTQPVNLVNQSQETPPVERFLLARPNLSSASARESISKKEKSL